MKVFFRSNAYFICLGIIISVSAFFNSFTEFAVEIISASRSKPKSEFASEAFNSVAGIKESDWKND